MKLPVYTQANAELQAAHVVVEVVGGPFTFTVAHQDLGPRRVVFSQVAVGGNAAKLILQKE